MNARTRTPPFNAANVRVKNHHAIEFWKNARAVRYLNNNPKATSDPSVENIVQIAKAFEGVEYFLMWAFHSFSLALRFSELRVAYKCEHLVI